MSIIRDIKQPILTNPNLSSNVRSILGKLLDSIDADLDEHEYTAAADDGSTTGDLLQEYNNALIEETPQEEVVLDSEVEEPEEDTFSKKDVLDDFDDSDKSK